MQRGRIFINPAEMYLRVIYEFGEEPFGLPPTRPKLQQRLRVSRPTLDRQLMILRRDELVVLTADRRVELTRAGCSIAEIVMRRHRLVERLLVDVIKLGWESAHAEANRWQHVLGERAERHIFQLLGRPTTSPFGNPIPALAGLSDDSAADGHPSRTSDPLITSVGRLSRSGGGRVRLHHIGEGAQGDRALLLALGHAKVSLGAALTVLALSDDRVRIVGGGDFSLTLSEEAASCLFVATDDRFSSLADRREIAA